ncbi:MAG: hypothetical protein ACYCX3_11600 [Thermoleophilia bacterium]
MEYVVMPDGTIARASSDAFEALHEEILDYLDLFVCYDDDGD